MRHAFSLDLVANYAGAAWIALLQILLVPLYVEVLGVESYGLIAFCGTLHALAQFLDFGLAPTMNRELARRGRDDAPSTRSFVATVAAIYWLVAMLLGLGIAWLSGTIAARWITVAAMPESSAAHAIALMGGVVALQWPIACYHGALLGLHKQVTVNLLNIGASTASAAVVLWVMWRVSATVEAFLWCRIGVLAAHVVLARWFMWRALPAPTPGARARFDLTTLAPVWKFTLGMMLISATAIVLQQFDKVVLSNLLSMELFGCYMVAAAMANCVPQLVAPIYTAVFPRLTRLVASGERAAAVQLFHQTAQLIALVAQPVAIAFAWFAPDIIMAWTGNATVTAHGSAALLILAVGALLNSVMVAPYVAQLAHGCTRIGVLCNSVMACAMVPYALVATSVYGVCGAASAWAVVNAIYVAVGAPLTFRQILRGEAGSWLRQDVLSPVAVVVAVQATVWWLGAGHTSTAALVAKLALALALSAAGVVVVCRELRARLATVVHTYRTAL
jgi:O-antigen/teichoic acid export membrane protein